MSAIVVSSSTERRLARTATHTVCMKVLCRTVIVGGFWSQASHLSEWAF